MIVIGGYNSSNTCNLARICAARVPTFHIADPDCLVSPRPDPAPAGRCAVHRADGRKRSTDGWLPAAAGSSIGLTAGASTPNNIVGQVIETVSRFAADASL